MKKTLLSILAIVACGLAALAGFKGDVNGDGSVTASDVTALYNYLLYGDSSSIVNGDTNGDDDITSSDVTYVYNILLGYAPLEEENVIEYEVNGVKFKMVDVEGGTFTMGATAEQGGYGFSNEKPAHQVTLSSFAIGQTEVTQELWQAVMGSNPSYFNGGAYGIDLKRPVEKVNWDDCQTFIAKLNQMLPIDGYEFRLPTEAEWEYAARGGNKSQGYKYSGSNTLGNVAWYSDNIPSQSFGTLGYGTQTVATKQPNELGIYDMSGNVWEWCQDWYASNYYSESPSNNPTGPESGSQHVYRGGGWNADPTYCRVSYREGITSGFATNVLGLRIVLAPEKTDIEFTAGDVTFKMIKVKGGTFTMGASDTYEDEYPSHQVTLSTFYIGQTEVTQELWKAVMGSNPSWFNSYGNSDSDSFHEFYNYGTNLQRPVEFVSWEDCQLFITKLNQMTGKNFRLPTEAEWEYAARGGKSSHGYTYAGSNTIGDVAWYWENIPSQTIGTTGYGTQTVATRQPNELGLYDMSGNVWEWCMDWFGDYSSEAQTNPTGPATGSQRVYRGGSWAFNDIACRVLSRVGWVGSGCSLEVGLRLAL